MSYTPHKNNCRAKCSRAYLSYSARAIFSDGYFCGVYQYPVIPRFRQNRRNRDCQKEIEYEKEVGKDKDSIDAEREESEGEVYEKTEKREKNWECYSRVTYIYVRSRAKYLKFRTTTSKINTLRKPLMQQKYYFIHEM